MECFEISHPNFSKTYYVCRNPPTIAGVDVTHEDSTVKHYDYLPLQAKMSEIKNDLDNAVNVQLGDIGEIFPLEFDNIEAADGFSTKPTVKYRLYRSDILTAPMFGPLVLEAPDWTAAQQGQSFDAQAPKLSVNQTGEKFLVPRFPMLLGFL